MKTYQVVQNLEWSCPKMLLFVLDDMVVGHQTNPDNGLTMHWYEDGEEVPFDPCSYKECNLISTEV